MDKIGRLLCISRVPAFARARSPGSDHQPQHISETPDIASNSSLPNVAPYHTTASNRDHPKLQHLSNPTSTQSVSSSHPGTLSSDTKGLFRWDKIEDILPGARKERTLEEEYDLPGEVDQRSREALQGWNLTSHAIEELRLPTKIDHPGSERYIDKELKSRPKWLWDSETKKTVLAEDYMFDQGYVAVSYTWGRWRDSWCTIRGTPWSVPTTKSRNPSTPEIVCNFNIEDMMDILCRMPNVRYFWIDVLCINQKPQTMEQKKEKKAEIDKQGSIFKEANGVLVYLWSVDEGAQFKSAIRELGNMMCWYWQIAMARTKHDAHKPCIDESAKILRQDPWFSSLWTLQEMILAPASVWIARDGSHCRLNGKTITTHTLADKFQDFVLQERLHDDLGRLTLGLSRNYIQSNIPESMSQYTEILMHWLEWAFQSTAITTCLIESRGGILQATLQRRYIGRRELAVLAALKVGNEKQYDKDEKLVEDLSVTLWNQLIRAEGGRLFDSTQPAITPMANMFPTSADFTHLFRGIRDECIGWEVEENGELKIPHGSPIGHLSDRDGTMYELPLAGKPIKGGDPGDTVKEYMSKRGIDVKHVRFVIIGYQPPYSRLSDGDIECTGIRGVILVTESDDIYQDACRWYKAGMFFSRDFRREQLECNIIIGKRYGGKA
ncbi:hypothetical protein FOMA001_g17948 [Fusarium oxysporum f. sp. matthiolae]|nr:hypothetical protein FOMA001_g17948 [Fusarium oxysporum f. sp. matthiolae]